MKRMAECRNSRETMQPEVSAYPTTASIAFKRSWPTCTSSSAAFQASVRCSTRPSIPTNKRSADSPTVTLPPRKNSPKLRQACRAWLRLSSQERYAPTAPYLPSCLHLLSKWLFLRNRSVLRRTWPGRVRSLQDSLGPGEWHSSLRRPRTGSQNCFLGRCLL